VTGPGEEDCEAAGLAPLRPGLHPSLLVRFRGVGNNAVKGAFKAAGFRREAPGIASSPAFGPDCLVQAGCGRWTALWGGQLTGDEYAALASGQKVNHFPCANELGRKDRLAKALEAAAARCPGGAFDFTPRTFCFPGDAPAWAAEMVRAAAAAAEPRDNDAPPPVPRLYIAKPPALSRGRGVRVVTASQVTTNRRLLVQRYIHPPHLLDGLKYDLRLYVLVTSVTPLRAYLHTSGLVRFATAPYDPHSRDGAAHVTNVSQRSKEEATAAPGAVGPGPRRRSGHGGSGAAAATAVPPPMAPAPPPPSQNAYIPNVAAADDGTGHKWSLEALRRRLEAEEGEGVWEGVWSRIGDVVARTLIAVNSRMGPASAASGAPSGVCFELYGFDVLLDGDLQPWLLEVNTGPNLAAPTPLDVHVKCRIAAEMLHLAGISPPAEPGAAQPPPAPQGGAIPPPSAPLAQQPLAVRQMVAEEGRCGGFERIFPSRKAADNARLLPLLQPPCALTAACCAYVAHTAAGQ